MFLKVIGDPKIAAEKLGTNVPLKLGQVLSGNEKMVKVMSQKHPDLFVLVDKDGAELKEIIEPKDKMMHKKNKFKSKSKLW